MKKIMFNDRYGLTQAVLEGRKTMTRRIIKAPKKMDGEEVYGFAIVKRPGSDEVVEVMALNDEEGMINNILPKYKPGEVVAVAQAYESIHDEMMTGDYGADIYDAFRNSMVADKPGWRNKMFVRADLMPHQIRITNVRVERLQDISDEDCIREGVDEFVLRKGDGTRRTKYSFKNATDNYLSPREAYAALIDKVSGKGMWESNPWVFVYEFELIK